MLTIAPLNNELQTSNIVSSGAHNLNRVNSRAWLDTVLREKTGVTRLHPFQLQHAKNLVDGRDLFLVIATGGGKTLVLLAPLVAAQARGDKGIGFFVVPTKSLVEQQASKAQSYGLRAIALTEDTVRAAVLEKPRRDLFHDLAAGNDVRLAVLSPQMLRGDRMTKLCREPAFKAQIRWMLIDEADLAEDPGVFGTPYKSLSPLRNIFPSKTIWAAATGSATPGQSRSLAKTYGFLDGHYVNARYSLDRPNIKYTTRFLRHPYTTGSFLDLSFLIPIGVTSAREIPSTIVFVHTIATGHALMVYLSTLIPLTITDRLGIVKLYNSLGDADYRKQFIRDFEDGSTLRISIVTDTMTFGADLRVSQGVILDIPVPASPNNMKQKRGRVGRDGLPAEIKCYAAPWVRVPTSPPITAQGKEDAKRRSQLPLVTLQWYNPQDGRCPRAVDMMYFSPESSFSCDNDHPSCSFHAKEDDSHPDLVMVACWEDHFKKQELKGLPKYPRSDGTYKALDSRLKESLTLLIERWSATTWARLRGTNINISFRMFLPDHITQVIVERAHTCTTLERFMMVAHEWEYRATCGQDLFHFLVRALDEYKETFWEDEGNEIKSKCEGTSHSVLREDTKEQVVSDNGMEDVFSGLRIRLKVTPQAPAVGEIDSGTESKRHAPSGNSPRKKRQRVARFDKENQI